MASMSGGAPFLLVALLGASLGAQQPLDELRFSELQQQLTPSASEAWRRIPWRIDLLAAQREAVAQNKPLFIWAMDGHPLGCT
jgi:hypothetical protein